MTHFVFAALPWVALLSLGACSSTPRVVYQPAVDQPRYERHYERYDERPLGYCCETTARPCHRVPCRTLYPDALDDFGPRPGQVRVIRCEHWQSLDRYTRYCVR